MTKETLNESCSIATVNTIKEYIANNGIQINWNQKNFEFFFRVWGYPKIDLNNRNDVECALASVWSSHLERNMSIGNFFAIFNDMDLYVESMKARITPFVANIDSEFEVNMFLLDATNREKILDSKVVEDFIFGFFKKSNFVSKLALFIKDQDLNHLGDQWSLENWFEKHFSNWGTEDWNHPSEAAGLEIFMFLNSVVMPIFNDLSWSTAFVMNFIDCAR